MTVGRNAGQVFLLFAHSDNQLFLSYVCCETQNREEFVSSEFVSGVKVGDFRTNIKDGY